MPCSNCGAELYSFPVAPDLRELLPGEPAHATVCTACLELEPADDGPDEPPAFAEISDAIPDDPDAATAAMLLVGLLPSLAIYRTELTTLVERLERAGVDPFLLLDRLAADPALEPHFDLEKRRTQLIQLIE